MKIEFPIFTVNGNPGGSISPLDRGFAYGDGVFETCRVFRGQIPLWPLHKERLLRSCEQLRIDCNPTQLDTYCQQILSLLANSENQDLVLKIIVTRGIAGRGYRIPASSEPTYCMLAVEGKPLFSEHYAQGVNLRICDYRLNSNPALARLKHLNRLEQILARSEWGDEFYEGLLLDQAGNVIEATSSNLFFVSEGKLITPDLSLSGVEGVMRRLILEQLAPTIGVIPAIKSISLTELEQAEELFICNSLAGILPVVSIDFLSTSVMPYGVGSITRQLQIALENVLSKPSLLQH